MAKDDSWLTLIAIGLAIIAIILVVSKGSGNIVVQSSDNINTISSSGRAELMVAPDQVEVHIRIQTEGLDAKEVQAENRRIADSVTSALSEIKVKEKEIESTQYRLEKIREWNRNTQKSEDKGYRLYHVMTVTSDDVEKAGEIIDAAVESGANGIDGISFGLSDDKMLDVQDEVLKLAASEARKKAESMADSLGVSIGKPVRVSESQYDFIPYARAESAVMAMDAEIPETKISAEDVEVRATVNVDYEIK